MGNHWTTSCLFLECVKSKTWLTRMSHGRYGTQTSKEKSLECVMELQTQFNFKSLKNQMMQTLFMEWLIKVIFKNPRLLDRGVIAYLISLRIRFPIHNWIIRRPKIEMSRDCLSCWRLQFCLQKWMLRRWFVYCNHNWAWNYNIWNHDISTDHWRA